MTGEKASARFAVCVRNEGAEDLEPRKVYQVLPDREAGREGLVRVIDESGEDYLYPSEYFAPVRLPVAIARAFVFPAQRTSRLAAHKARRG